MFIYNIYKHTHNYDVRFKYITILLGSYVSIKLKKPHKNTEGRVCGGFLEQVLCEPPSHAVTRYIRYTSLVVSWRNLVWLTKAEEELIGRYVS